MKKILLALAGLLILATSFAQSVYNQREAFNPQFYPYPGNDYRSASGEPGPKYWQNKADYSINCSLDTATHTVTGAVTITYTNNSPDNLRFLWLQLDQNIYKKDSRGSATTTEAGGRWANGGFTDGYKISQVQVESAGISYEASNNITTDTRMREVPWSKANKKRGRFIGTS